MAGTVIGPSPRGAGTGLLPEAALQQDWDLELGLELACGTATCWNQGSVVQLSSRAAGGAETPVHSCHRYQSCRPCTRPPMTTELAQVGVNATCEVQVWCRHCKSLSPIPFETRAKLLASPRTHLSNADHTRSLQFPTIQSVSQGKFRS